MMSAVATTQAKIVGNFLSDLGFDRGFGFFHFALHRVGSWLAWLIRILWLENHRMSSLGKLVVINNNQLAWNPKNWLTCRF